MCTKINVGRSEEKSKSRIAGCRTIIEQRLGRVNVRLPKALTN